MYCQSMHHDVCDQLACCATLLPLCFSGAEKARDARGSDLTEQKRFCAAGQGGIFWLSFLSMGCYLSCSSKGGTACNYLNIQKYLELHVVKD